VDEMQAVADFCAEQRPPGPERLALARARVLDEITSAAPPGAGRPRGRGRARVLTWPRLAAFGAVAIAAAVAVVVAGGIPLGGGSPLAPPASAAQVLQRAATAALAEPVAQAGQFIYTETRTVSEWKPTTVTRRWTSADGAAQGASALVPCPAWYDLHMVPSVLPAGWFYYQGQPYRPSCLMALPGSRRLAAPETYAGLETLPTDPATLLAYIDAHYQPIFKIAPDTTASIEWDGLRQILTDNVVVPPKLGAAIFRAAAMLPGIRLFRNVTDAAGGRGIAVAAPLGPPREPWLLDELIFDPGTYRFIGSQIVVVRTIGKQARRGTVFNAMAVLRTAITNTAPAGPFNVQTPVIVGPGTWH
jgi:hypothetical protein